ncbi:MAG TPA: polysaccharide deacetylase family protein [Deltaproteobacteria bacterium]|nr:polysaccharide deacetylase family protein [Deltaproteobacteria bacterium]
MATLALKVDIDTYQGFTEGLPNIIRILGRRGLKSSFFVSFGPDRSGLALVQLLRPRFLWKMLRTNAPSTYGLKTALYGTLLKPPLIGLQFPDAVRQLRDLGHEVACHAWDHRLWQDWLPWMSATAIHAWFGKMVGAYETAIGEKPQAFGAPGWRMDKRVLAEVSHWGFQYVSCTRAHGPFMWAENGLLEIPSNLPCIEEVGLDGVLAALKRNADQTIPQVLPVHTEIEGRGCQRDFEQVLDIIADLGYQVMKIADIARRIDTSHLETRALREGFLPGRAFKCAV